MKKNKTAIGMLLLTLALISTTVSGALPAKIDNKDLPTLAPLVERVSPAVVNIAARGSVQVHSYRNPFMDDPFFRRFFEQQPGRPQTRQTQSAGSGVVVDAAKGYIITNHHVIANAEEITVTLSDDRSFTAEIIGSDEGSDIAVIRIEADNLTELDIADSEDIRVGDFVVAIGNPFGLGNTVTSGIVSALGRSGLNPQGYEDFIQTDASINPGNSGGALVSLNGELVGINSAILTRGGGNIGIGFAIPSNMASAVMAQILEFGEVRRGLLGVNIYTVTPDIAEAYGVEEMQGALISQVLPGSAADTAGLVAGDIVTHVNDESIKSAAELRNSIGLLRIGDEVTLRVVNDGETRMVKAVLGEQVAPEQVEAADLHRGLEGAEFVDADPGNPDQGGLAGVLVTSVEADSPAAQRGLRAGDVILAVNRKRVTSISEFRDIAEDSSSLLLNIRRGGTDLLLPIR
jgi:serine protease Do/serine protease DegQ